MDTYLEQAFKEIPSLEVGDVFTVRDLFKGYIWKRIPRNERLYLGRKFYDKTLNPYLADGTIEETDKNSAGQQQYIKAK